MTATLPLIVQQHAEETALLRSSRSYLVRAAHIGLRDLARHDDRIAAHLDGLAIAGDAGWRCAQTALDRPGTGEVFTATVRALSDARTEALHKLLALAEAVPEARAGLRSAFGWVPATHLRGVTRSLLDSSHAFHREVGLAACSFHGADPGSVLAAALDDADASLRSRALRLAGELGRLELLPACLARLADDEPACRFHATRAALLLGNRQTALDGLQALALASGPFQAEAVALFFKLVPPAQARPLLAMLARQPAQLRFLLQGVAFTGDPDYVPWLIARMAELPPARLAGQAFSFISGASLAALHLDTDAPDEWPVVPDEDPAANDAAMDEDESLPWPDPNLVVAWWQSKTGDFAAGSRYFVGEPPSVAHCISVLKNGFQRQRIAAAEYLCLLQPGTPLFNVAAPAWRQQRLLAQMGA